MTKNTLSYLAGAMSVAIAVFLNGGRGTLIAFALGAFAVAAITVAMLGSVRRLRRAASVLTAIASSLEASSAAKVDAAEQTIDPLEEEVVSALVNFKMPRKRAEQAARRAMESHPGADFQTVFSYAVSIGKVAA
jgi:hypothetical protein